MTPLQIARLRNFPDAVIRAEPRSVDFPQGTCREAWQNGGLYASADHPPDDKSKRCAVTRVLSTQLGAGGSR